MEIRLSSVLLAATLLCGCSWFHRGGKAPAEAPKRVGTKVGVAYKAVYVLYGEAK